jgi:hypothetical protein
VDPVRKEYESPYAVFGNNPILYIDPNGADSTTSQPKLPRQFWKNNKDNKSFKASKEFKEFVKNNDLKPGEQINRVDGVYIFSRESQNSDATTYYWLNGKNWIEFIPKEYVYPVDNNPLKTIFWDATLGALSPVDDLDVYVTLQVKKTVDVNVGNQTFNGTMVQYGIQAGVTTENGQGGYGNFVTFQNSYINYKVPGSSTEIRLVPFSGSLKVPLGLAPQYGDFKPALRSLTTLGVYRGVTIQGEFVMSNNIQGGLRGKVETPKLAGYSIEGAGGVRASLKVPKLFTAIYDVLK